MKKLTALLAVVVGFTDLRAGILDQGQTIVAGLLPPATLTNVSCRACVGTNANVAIVGFVVTGQAGSGIQVLIRGVGPALSQFALTGVLAQPVLTLFDSSGKPLATNTGWSANSNLSLIIATMAATGAFALPWNSADS